MHPTTLQLSKDEACWQVYCLTMPLWSQREIFSYLPAITGMIKPFDAKLSPCQAKGWCRRGQKSWQTGHLAADITEWRISQTKCCSCLRLPSTLLSCLKRRISRSASDPSTVQAVALHGSHTHRHTLIQSPNRDTFCSQFHSLRSGRLLGGPQRPQEMETLTSQKTLILVRNTPLKICIFSIKHSPLVGWNNWLLRAYILPLCRGWQL